MNIVEQLIEADKCSLKGILVIGDCMFDTYICGELYNTCQEGCQKFVHGSRVTVPGGAANAARSIENWNSRVVCIPGKTPGLPEKFRFMEGDKCVFRYDDDRCNLDLAYIRWEALNTFELWMPDAVLLSDYDKGMLTEDFIQKIVTKCNRHNIPCVVDAKRDPDMYKGAIIKGNEDYYKKYGKELCHGKDYFVITHGHDSPYIQYIKGEVINSKKIRVKCINHIGAGDCFAAHMTLALANNFFLKEAATIAHSAARVYVQHSHNTPPQLSEILADFNSQL